MLSLKTDDHPIWFWSLLSKVFPISIPASPGFFATGWSPGETLGNSNILSFDWLFHVTTYCFAPEILHFHFIVPEPLQATNHCQKSLRTPGSRLRSSLVGRVPSCTAGSMSLVQILTGSLTRVLNVRLC